MFILPNNKDERFLIAEKYIDFCGNNQKHKIGSLLLTIGCIWLALGAPTLIILTKGASSAFVFLFWIIPAFILGFTGCHIQDLAKDDFMNQNHDLLQYKNDFLDTSDFESVVKEYKQHQIKQEGLSLPKNQNLSIPKKILSLITKAGFTKEINLKSFPEYKKIYAELSETEEKAWKDGIEMEFLSLAVHPSVYKDPINYLDKICGVYANAKNTFAIAVVKIDTTFDRHHAIADVGASLCLRKKPHFRLYKVRLNEKTVKKIIFAIRQSSPAVFSKEAKWEYAAPQLFSFGFFLVTFFITKLIGIDLDALLIPWLTEHFGSFMIPLMLFVAITFSLPIMVIRRNRGKILHLRLLVKKFFKI
ncbi:hypothetical protein KAJ61_02020 [Candidatus Parcubacteria bacterium]|nr:hypothetical protein [Candidatus Parcubacteria bacterium]